MSAPAVVCRYSGMVGETVNTDLLKTVNNNLADAHDATCAQRGTRLDTVCCSASRILPGRQVERKGTATRYHRHCAVNSCGACPVTFVLQHARTLCVPHAAGAAKVHSMARSRTCSTRAAHAQWHTTASVSCVAQYVRRAHRVCRPQTVPHVRAAAHTDPRHRARHTQECAPAARVCACLRFQSRHSAPALVAPQGQDKH